MSSDGILPLAHVHLLSNNLGCLGSILVSTIGTLPLLLLVHIIG
jgi:hypothetical protein